MRHSINKTKPTKANPPATIQVQKVAEADFPTRFGQFRICGFSLTNGAAPETAVVLVRGKPRAGRVPLVRIHSQCLTGDVFASLRCDCREQLEMALAQVGASDYGFIIYEPQEGRGIGLMNKLQAYQLQDKGIDTIEANRKLGFEADLRQYTLAAGILQHYGVKSVRLLSNNPDKIQALESFGIAIRERVPIEAKPHKASARYLKTKLEKMGHLLSNAIVPKAKGKS
jgi:GTP cyclohydrolase II